MKKILVLIAAASALLFESCKNEVLEWSPTPPFKGLEVPMSVFEINPNTDTVITLLSGTSIFIPAGCFVNTNGEIPSSSIDLLYREFHDALDIFLSGIHMDFYSMGEKRTFQTAGMFEIDAKTGDEKLRIADGKNIDIRFGSMYPGENYNFFFLEPSTGTWEWVDMPSTEVNQEKVDALKALEGKLPKLNVGDDFFVLNYMGFIDIYYDNQWDKIYKNRDNKADEKFLKSYTSKIYDATVYGEVKFGRGYYHPYELLWRDLDGKPFPKWTNGFNLNWEKDENKQWYITNFQFKSIGNNQYEVFYNNKNSSFRKRMEAFIPLKNLLKLPAAEWQKRYDEAMAEIAEEQSRIDLMAETFRAFSINRLGVYNFDALMNMDDWFIVDPTFTISDDVKTNHSVIIIFGDNSGYLTLKPNELKTLRINPESGHRILMMLSENELGILQQDELMALNTDSLRTIENPTVIFALQSQMVEDAIALREILGFK